MPIIKTAGIISKPNSTAAEGIVPKLIEWLRRRGIAVRLDEQTAAYAGGVAGMPRDEVPQSCDLVIVLGGDGTLLSAARAIGRREIPLFPVNLGSLGFLTAITIDELYPELERALRGEHRIAKRKLMTTEVIRDGQVVDSYDALNDAVLTKSSIARMIDLDTLSTSSSSALTRRRADHRDADGPRRIPFRRAGRYFPRCPPSA